MSDEERENEWGNKKQQYYSMNHRDDDDSDYIEDEKEAIRIQKMKLEKIKKSKLLNEIEDEDEEENKIKLKGKKKEEEKKNIIIDTDKLYEDLKITGNIINEVNDNFKDKINKLSKINGIDKTIEYLKLNKNIHLSLAACYLFSVINSLDKKMTNHHPSIKTIALVNYLLKNNDKNEEEIEDKLKEIIDNINNNNENKINEKKNKEIENEEEENEEFDNEEIENENEEDEEIENEENDNEEDDYDDMDEFEIDTSSKKKPLIKDNKLEEKESKIKLPSSLLKKKRNRINEEKSNKTKEEIDDNISENNSESENNILKKEKDSKEKIKKTKEEKKENIKKEKERLEELQKEIKRKNDLMIRKANREVLLARGLVRKRKSYAGNAKLVNREKYYKKERERKSQVKEFIGAPDVYGGEVTGMRRDLIRSTKFKS